jgi:hypothetical protein
MGKKKGGKKKAKPEPPKPFQFKVDDFQVQTGQKLVRWMPLQDPVDERCTKQYHIRLNVEEDPESKKHKYVLNYWKPKYIDLKNEFEPPPLEVPPHLQAPPETKPPKAPAVKPGGKKRPAKGKKTTVAHLKILPETSFVFQRISDTRASFLGEPVLANITKTLNEGPSVYESARGSNDLIASEFHSKDQVEIMTRKLARKRARRDRLARQKLLGGKVNRRVIDGIRNIRTAKARLRRGKAVARKELARQETPGGRRGGTPGKPVMRLSNFTLIVHNSDQPSFSENRFDNSRGNRTPITPKERTVISPKARAALSRANGAENSSTSAPPVVSARRRSSTSSNWETASAKQTLSNTTSLEKEIGITDFDNMENRRAEVLSSSSPDSSTLSSISFQRFDQRCQTSKSFECVRLPDFIIENARMSCSEEVGKKRSPIRYDYFSLV